MLRPYVGFASPLATLLMRSGLHQERGFLQAHTMTLLARLNAYLGRMAAHLHVHLEFIHDLTQNGGATFGLGVDGSIQCPWKRDIVHHRYVKFSNKSSICFPNLKLVKGCNLHERPTAPGKRELGRSSDVDPNNHK